MVPLVRLLEHNVQRSSILYAPEARVDSHVPGLDSDDAHPVDRRGSSARPSIVVGDLPGPFPTRKAAGRMFTNEI
jgi:hypothetical protein